MIILRFLARRLRVAAQLGSLLLAAFSILNAIAATAGQATQPILVVGDSISAAYGMELEQGWVALLESRLKREGRPYYTVNASISGDTSAGGLRRLPALLEKHEPNILIIELGGNDGLRGYPIKQLQNNLIKMAELAKAAGAQVLVLPMEIPPNFGQFYTNAFRGSFVKAAEETNVTLASFPLTSVALSTDLMQADGIHPTEAAQPLIMESVWRALETLL